jgi:soluble lytic murein transglycosylase-like protein
LAVCFSFALNSNIPAQAWSLPAKLVKKNDDKAKSAAKDTKKSETAKPATDKDKKPAVAKSVAEKSPAPKPIKVSKGMNPKPASVAKISTPDDKLVKSEIASVEAFAAMAIDSGSANNVAKQSVARQYFFRNAFIARPNNALPEDQVSQVATYIQSYNKKVPNTDVRTYAEAIVYFSQFYQVNPKLVTGMIAIESSFRTDAVSTSGAIGLGQLKPDTASWLSVSDPYDPVENIGGMTRYISWLVRKYNGSYDHAVSAYYQGPGTVDRNGITEACLPYLYKVNDALARF